RAHGQHAPLHSHSAPAAATDGADDDRAATIDVAVEQRMQRHDRIVVLGRRVHEVDDQPRLLAGMAAGDAPDALLVDALGGRRRQVHADGRARAVPALGQQLRVYQHVDVAALIAGENLRQLALWRLAGNALRLDPLGAKGLRGGVRVADARRVHDAGNAVEARPVEVRHGQVEGLLVEQFGQLVLVELGIDLAAAQWHLGDRAHTHARRDAHAAQRRDPPAPRRLREVEARGLRRKQIGDMTRDQRAGGGHADEQRTGPLADRAARLLAQRRVVLVADDDRVRARDLARVAHEPLVGLHGHRAFGRVLSLQQRAADALGVVALAQLAVELVDKVAPVGEDQHPARLRGLHESKRRHRLAGAGRVLEPEPLGGIWVLWLLGQRLLFLVPLLDPVARLLLGVALPLRLLLRFLLVHRDQIDHVLQIVVVLVLVGSGALNRPELVVVLVELVV